MQREITLSGEGLGVLDRLAMLLENSTALTCVAETVLRRVTEEALAAGVDPATGQAWAPLAASTLRRRAQEGRGREPRTDALRRSLYSGCSADSAWIGSDVPQAATCQFGARRGAFGRLPDGRPLPWGDIPARPFLGLSPEAQDTLTTALLQQLLRAVSE